MRPPLRAVPAALVLTVLCGSAAPAAAQASLPEGREVIARFIAAIGGRDAILRHRARHFTGRFEATGQGIAGEFELYQAPPNRMVTTATLPGIGTVREGYDGTVAWTTNPATGPMVLEGRALDQRRHGAEFYLALYPPEMVASVETVAEETFEGTPAWKVKVTTTWGESYAEYFDQATALQLGSMRTLFTPMGEVEATSVVSDWRTVDGVRMPFRLVQRFAGIETVVTFSDLSLAPLPDSLFALPAEVRALVGK
ncbi:MAG TPA: hypothetical protein VFH97_05755 [Gemmatimonadales bacterium]|nr:hypothetical protein [Gemmatimonadales bacterium]